MTSKLLERTIENTLDKSNYYLDFDHGLQ